MPTPDVWYAIGLAQVTYGYILLRSFIRLCKFVGPRAHAVVLHRLYPRVWLAILIVGVNAFVLSFESSLQKVATRCGTMAVASLFYLLVSPVARFTAFSGLPLSIHVFVHQCLGWITVLQASLHASYHLITQRPTLLNIHSVSGFSSFATCTMIGLFCGLYYAGIAYELFIGAHRLLSVGLLMVLWTHITKARNVETLLVSIATAIWAISAILEIGSMLRFALVRVSVTPLTTGLLHLKLRMAHPRSIRRGQHIHLKIPRIGLFQRHPFLVLRAPTDPDRAPADTDPTSDTDRINELDILVQRRAGFTNRLWSLYDTPAIIDGPFGCPIDFRQYGAVVMFATGLGIVGHIPYIEAILNDHRHYRNMTRQISVHWVPESEDESRIIQPYMNGFLESDAHEGDKVDTHKGSKADTHNSGKDISNPPPTTVRQYLLDICIYNEDTRKSYGQRNRLRGETGSPRIQEILDETDELNTKVAISVCANLEIRRQVRTAFLRRKRVQSYLFFPDYQPV